MVCSIITQERLDRITECVNEMTFSSHENGGGGEMGAELNGMSPSYPEQDIEKGSDFSEEPRNSLCNNHAKSANGLNTPAKDEPSNPHVQGDYLEGAFPVIQDPTMTGVLAKEEAKVAVVRTHSNGEVAHPLEHQEEVTMSSSNMEVKLQRVDSMDSVNRYHWFSPFKMWVSLSLSVS